MHLLLHRSLKYLRNEEFSIAMEEVKRSIKPFLHGHRCSRSREPATALTRDLIQPSLELHHVVLTDHPLFLKTEDCIQALTVE